MVMGIVTILAAVLVPVLIQSRNRARSLACLSNLRQLSGALSLYTQEWSDRLPFLRGRPFASSWPTETYPDGSSATCLRAALQGKIRGEGVFACPNDSGAPEFGFGPGRHAAARMAGSSYLPWSTARPGHYGLAVNGSATGSGRASSQICLLRDYGSEWHGVRGHHGLRLVARQTANAAFADGHVGSLRVQSLETSRGRYTGYATSTSDSGGRLHVTGHTDYGDVDLSGRYHLVQTLAQRSGEMRVYLSGEIIGPGGHYEVDKAFTFGGSSELEYILRQLVSLLEGIYAQ